MTMPTPLQDRGLKDALVKGGLATFVLLLFFFAYTLGKTTASELFTALPYFLLFYFIQFTMGRAPVVRAFQLWIQNNRWNVLLFPTAILLLYVAYLLLNGQNIVRGNPGLLVYLLYFPVAVFAWRNAPGSRIGWLDFAVFTLALLPSALFSVKQNSNVPINGGFDSLSHMMVIFTGVYAFAVVRGIKEVGFELNLDWKSLRTALLVWIAFYSFVFIFGRSVNFITIVGYSGPVEVWLKTLLFTMIGTFLHTALYEELFFRGILQNMLAKRIGQGKSWFIFWSIGFGILLIGALVVGYTLEGQMKWFPALVTVVLFGAAYVLEKSGKFEFGVYTALAITGVTFGLVHYHAKSIVYIGLACLAGWAYGYTYHKTKSVFYSALVHTLVNTGVLIFGLKMMR